MGLGFMNIVAIIIGWCGYRLLWLPFMSPAVTSFSSLMRGAKYESTLAALPPALSICTLHGNRCTSPQLVRECLNLIGCFSDDIITWSRGGVDITNKGLTRHTKCKEDM